MKVFVPSPLYSYTARAAVVEAAGTTLRDAMDDLDRRFPGLRFRIIDEQDRIRPHIKIFVNTDQVPDLETRLKPSDDIHIVAALSGG